MSIVTISITAPVVDLRDGEERVTLRMGGKRYTLVGDGEDIDVRGLAVALHTAKAVRLDILEGGMPVPQCFKEST